MEQKKLFSAHIANTVSTLEAMLIAGGYVVLIGEGAAPNRIETVSCDEHLTDDPIAAAMLMPHHIRIVESDTVPLDPTDRVVCVSEVLPGWIAFLKSL